jgi:hypothetical protein
MRLIWFDESNRYSSFSVGAGYPYPAPQLKVEGEGSS